MAFAIPLVAPVEPPGCESIQGGHTRETAGGAVSTLPRVQNGPVVWLMPGCIAGRLLFAFRELESLQVHIISLVNMLLMVVACLLVWEPVPPRLGRRAYAHMSADPPFEVLGLTFYSCASGFDRSLSSCFTFSVRCLGSLF